MSRTLTIVIILICASSGAGAGTACNDPDFKIDNPCTIAWSHNVPCIVGMTQNVNWVSGTVSTAIQADGPPVGMPLQGTSIETVHQNYPGVMLWDFEKLTAPQLNAQFKLLDRISLARFSHAYYLATDGKMAPLMALAKAKLYPNNYALFAQAFDSASATTIPQSAAAHIKAGAVHPTMNGLSGGIAAPNINMTLQEIYDEYLFTEATTAEEALYLMTKFAAKNLAARVTWGWTIGSAYYAFASYVDPDYGYDLVTTYGSFDDFNVVPEPTQTVSVSIGEITTNWDDIWVPTDGGC